jgi:excisionase family DNA binding protein
MCEGDPNDRILNLREAAGWLRIHWKTLQEMARWREIPAFKIRTGWRFRLSDLQAWVASQVRWPKKRRRS